MRHREAESNKASHGAPSKEGASYVLRFLHDGKGTAAIEFAFVGAVFLAILFGIVTYGFQFATRIALSYAVAEAGRSAVAGLSDAERQLIITDTVRHVVEGYEPLLRWSNVSQPISIQWRNEPNIGRVGIIHVVYTDSRFSRFPLIPLPDETTRVEARFVVGDELS